MNVIDLGKTEVFRVNLFSMEQKPSYILIIWPIIP